jgi:hypothetical protein
MNKPFKNNYRILYDEIKKLIDDQITTDILEDGVTLSEYCYEEGNCNIVQLTGSDDGKGNNSLFTGFSF